MQTDKMWRGQDLEELLAERFHIQTGFRPGQRELIERLLQGERMLAVQRMGWGKSLCYQMASLCLPHLTLVLSPLKAHLRDQCQRCNGLYGIPSALVSSGKSREENYTTFTQAMAGNIKILFLAPEQLDCTGWQSYIPKIKISLLVIEQAHCVSMLSHDFRLYYRRVIGRVNDLAPGIPMLLLTEVAKRCVEADILHQFCAVNIARDELEHLNLCLHVVRLNGDWEKLCYLAMVLQGHEDMGVIYTATQGSAVMIARFLCSRGIKAVYEPTDCNDAVRSDTEQDCILNRYSILCTLSGRGGNVDSANIRFVIHYHIPGSLIDYYREVRKPAWHDSRMWCVLLYDPVDMMQQEQYIEEDEPQEKHYAEVLSLLQAHSRGTHENNLLLNTGLSKARLRIILGDLLEQGLGTLNEDTRRYRLTSEALSGKSCAPGSGKGITGEHVSWMVDFSTHEQIRRKKLDELVALQQYTHTVHCYMAYLSNYLGDGKAGYNRCGACSNCSGQQFPDVRPTQRIQMAVTQFLEKDFLPCIERRDTEESSAHEGGWSLSYHAGNQIGRQVDASKYRGAGAFPLGLVLRIAEIAQTRYPVQDFDAVVSIPPTESGPLVEQFARQVADRLGREYFVGLVKTRPTYVQKRLSNQVQKANNVRGAFAVIEPEKLIRCTLLLIDDIYDSGCTLYEAGKTLMEAGALAVYPLTITRVLHTGHEQKGMV